jgi:hypothetical protein
MVVAPNSVAIDCFRYGVERKKNLSKILLAFFVVMSGPHSKRTIGTWRFCEGFSDA